MDVRQVFKSASDQLRAEFEASAEVHHSGGKGVVREDALHKLLDRKLPKRYSVGRGEVINSENYTSGQLDLVVYDAFDCPVIMSSPSHAVYPIESVFGVVSVKSSLGSEELRDAYQNIASFMNVVDRNGFDKGGSGLKAGMHFPRPVTGIFAFKADRSIDAIAKQIRELDEKLASKLDRPDFVCVLGTGIIGPISAIRGEFNLFSPPSEDYDLYAVQRTGRHTLFELYMRVLRELNMLALRPLNLRDYDNMPQLIGSHRVRRHDNFALTAPGNTKPAYASRLTKKGIDLIVAEAVEMTQADTLLARFGSIPTGMSEQDLKLKMYCYNPKSLLPMNYEYIREVQQGKTPTRNAFDPVQIQIDRKWYLVDLRSLPQDAIEDNPNFTYDELMSRQVTWL